MRTPVCLSVLFLIMMLAAAPAGAQGSISLDSVSGLTTQGNLTSGQPIRFFFRLTNSGIYRIAGSTNGFRVYSPDGAAWAPIVGDSVQLGWSDRYDGGLFFSAWSATGNGADTIGFGGFAMENGGLEVGFDQQSFIVETSIEAGQSGKTLCIDSCFYPPAGYWFWSHSIDGNSEPAWDGPHCFPIGGCCEGVRGDVNGDGAVVIDISDLVYLVDYMFTGGPISPCFEEMDINGDGNEIIDIADLVHLVDFMFTGGPSPADCP